MAVRSVAVETLVAAAFAVAEPTEDPLNHAGHGGQARPDASSEVVRVAVVEAVPAMAASRLGTSASSLEQVGLLVPQGAAVAAEGSQAAGRPTT